MMKQVGRWLFHCAAAISVLIFLASAALWIRSCWITDGLSHGQSGRAVGVWSHRGRLIVDTMGDDEIPMWPGFAGWTRERGKSEPAFSFLDTFPDTPKWRRLGFKHRSAGAAGLPTRRIEAWAIPDWFVMLLCLPIPIVVLRRKLRDLYRAAHQLCAACGYDLRASPDRCPECGRSSASP